MGKELSDTTLAMIAITLISIAECCPMVSNRLTSPGYPSSYPANIDCSVSIPIPVDMAIKIHFEDFYLEYSSSCRYDYLRITNEKDQEFGVYCGRRSGESVVVTGYNAVIAFHSDGSLQMRGFLLNVTEAPAVSPKAILPATTINVLPGYKLTCSSIGTPPVYTTLMRNSVVLLNATNSSASILVNEEGKYTCVAASKYGNDTRNISVVLIGCGSVVNNTLTSPAYPSNYLNDMDCNYSVPIPKDKAMKVYFQDFVLETSRSCRSDYLLITNDLNEAFGAYCSTRSGTVVYVTGDRVMLRFHTNHIFQRKGFLISFIAVPPAPPEVYIEKNVMLALPGDTLSCSASGIPPIYTAILRNSTVLVNATDAASTTLEEDGNYTCVATNKYGGDAKVISVTFFECASVSNNILTSPGYPNNYPKNFDCHYSIPFPEFKAIKIEFQYFDLEISNGDSCQYDYLAFKNGNNRMFGVFCGNKTGEVIFVIADSVEITFHSDGIVQKSGFRIAFTEVELASYPACLSQDKMRFKTPDEPWLRNPTTKCFCKSDLTVECLILDEPACMDIAGKIRNNNEEWLKSCVKCTCLNGTIKCSQYIVNITYGLFKVDEHATCEQCADSSATKGDSACEAFFQIPKEKLFHCSVRGSFVWLTHRCNGVRECPDGSDEMGCQNVVCSDNSGSNFIIKDDLGWQASPCVKCNCSKGQISCQRKNRVFFPHSSSSVYRFTEICAPSSCNVFHFLSAKGQTCEAIEVMENEGLLLKGQTYSNSGCDFYFDEPRNLYNPSDDMCPAMPRMACYVFNGGVCCTSECSALKEIATAIRGNVTYCPSGRQLADKASNCGESVIECSRDHGNQNCTSVATCRDEDSHKYFEGATWFVGRCIQCYCTEGKISCKREIDVIAPNRDTLTEYCNDTNCNVAKYMKTKEGVCKGCRWKGQLFDDGDHWKENGVDFYCSDTTPKVRPGCYVEVGRVSCTGAIPGIRDISKISNDSLFLCESGDEIRSLNDRCNGLTDCKDQSDERNCIHYYCESSITEGGVHWERTQAGHDNVKNCSLIDSSWQGTVTRKCVDGQQPSWSSWRARCRCERRRIINHFELKFAEVNETNLLDISKELSSSASNFTNQGMFQEMFTDLFDIAIELLKSNSSNNSDLKLAYGEHVIKTISEDTFYNKTGLCRDICIPPLIRERHILGQRALEMIRQVNKSAVSSIPALRQVCNAVANFVKKLQLVISIDSYQTVLLNQLNTAPLLVNKEDSSQVMTYNVNTTVVNKTGLEPFNTSDEDIVKILEEHGCKRATLDMNGKLIVKTSDASDEALRHQQIQTKMEIVLLCISVGAVALYFTVLLVLRIKMSEKTFVHVNLLLALGLGNLVYVVDKTAFTNRLEFPALCSFVAVSQHFLHTALFTWMLVEGINLYIKIVKVFSSVNKQYLIYTAIGWGTPAVIVVAVAAIRPSSYDMATPLMEEVTCGSLNFTSEIERTRCWINGSLWIYKGPVLFFLLVNFGLFAILLRVVFGRLAVKYTQEHIKRTRKGMRSIVALLPLLGVTYTLGYFIRFHTAVAYLFILLNSTQGIVFTIFHCFLDEQVCEELKVLRERRKTKPTRQTSTGNKTLDTKNLALLEKAQVESHPSRATLDSSSCRDECQYNTRL